MNALQRFACLEQSPRIKEPETVQCPEPLDMLGGQLHEPGFVVAFCCDGHFCCTRSGIILPVCVCVWSAGGR